MTINRIAVPAIALLFLGATSLGIARASAAPQGPPPPGFGQDGVEAARDDFNHQQRPDVNRREEFRHPRVPPDDKDAYREGFRRGYDVGISHLMHGPDQQMRGPEGGGPPMGMEQGSDIQRRGFHDGAEAAQSDMESHRRPNATRRGEYRHPPVPREVRDEYREAFQRGYQRAISQQMGGPDHR